MENLLDRPQTSVREFLDFDLDDLAIDDLDHLFEEVQPKPLAAMAANTGAPSN